MKRLIIIAVFTALILAASCSDVVVTIPIDRDKELSERVIVQHIGPTFDDDSMFSLIADINNIDAVTELSTQIILCHVEKVNDIVFTEHYTLNFEYTVTVKDIIFDVNKRLKVGDSITVSTPKGLIKGNDFTELVKDTEHAKKFGYQDRVYKENEYIASSSFRGIPMEAGKDYIICLTDIYVDSVKIYVDEGCRFLWEYTNGVIYTGLEYVKTDVGYEELKSNLNRVLARRTGRADEIGAMEFIKELGVRQAAEKEARQRPTTTVQD